jgi:hypothetical protein
MGRLVVINGWLCDVGEILDIMRMITHSHLEGRNLMDLFSSHGSHISERTKEIKAQVTTELGLDHGATIMVSELTCMEEGCPSVETVIAVFRPERSKLQFRLHASIAEITAHDIHEMCVQHINSTSENNHGNDS